MFLVQQIAPGAMAAMLVSAALCVAARWVAESGRRDWLGAFPIGIAYACGHAIVTGWPGFPPGDVTNWLFYFALAAVPVGGICALRISERARAIIALVMSAGPLALLLGPQFQYSWSVVQGVVWVAALAAVSVLLWVSLDILTSLSGGVAIALPLFMLIPAAGASVALLLSGSMVLGQLAIVLAAAALGAMLTKSRGSLRDRGAVPAFTLVFFSLLVCGYFYAELPASSAVLLSAAPPLGALVRADRSSIQLLAFRSGAMLLLVIAAVFLAFRASPPLDF
jgi:hypothetical protein